MAIQVFSNFDSGSAEVISVNETGEIDLAYAQDPGGAFKGWFHVRLSGVRGLPLKITMTNAGACNYAAGFETLQVVASYDRQHWFRAETRYDGVEQSIFLSPIYDTVYLANTPPYGFERHLDFIASTQARPGIIHDTLGCSLEGRPIDRLRLGSGSAQVWLVARQHPCEPMGNWFVEGFVDRLLDPSDGVSIALLEAATFNIVPIINPDGVARGLLRTNAAGRDLNREWAEPSLQFSPEVFSILAAMNETGVNALLDIHGDEFVNHTYGYGLHNPPSGDLRGPAALLRFLQALEQTTPDFRAADTCHDGFPEKPIMTMCTQQVVSRFGCLGVTIEMPFNDTTRHPNPVTGWGIERSRRFGAATLQALYQTREDWR